jgi:hypothetical protein
VEQQMNLAPLAGKKTYIAAFLALSGALLGGLDGDLTWPQSFDIIVPAVLGLTIRHGISTSALSLAASLAASIAKAASDAGKTIAVLLLVLGLGGAVLTACTPAEIAEVQVAVAASCAAYAPVAAKLAGSNTGTVQSILAYGASVCDAQGNVIPGVSVDSSTAAWVGSLTGLLQAALAVAVL